MQTITLNIFYKQSDELLRVAPVSLGPKQRWTLIAGWRISFWLGYLSAPVVPGLPGDVGCNRPGEMNSALTQQS